MGDLKGKTFYPKMLRIILTSKWLRMVFVELINL